jgi:hypothetical protein
LQVVVWISPGIAGAPVADFEINNVFARSIDQMMAVASTGFETRAHSWRERRLAVIRDEYRVPRQDVNEFVLL